MIRSMTGYGKGQGATENVALTVEIKSVNHRYTDISIKSPRALLPLESEIRKRVGDRLRRGKIDIFISQDALATATARPAMNRPLAAAYVDLFREMRAAFDLGGEVSVSLLANQKDVIVLQEGDVAEAEVRSALETALSGALDALERMRVAEGEATRRDLDGRLEAVEAFLSQVEGRSSQVPKEWLAKLTDRLARLSQDLEFDPQRVAQEVAIFADRCDVSEEIVRFRSHLQQFRSLLDLGEPVGRQMDFLLQELNRETNTMGSKANDAELTRLVVAIKAELEKIREQVQNIE